MLKHVLHNHDGHVDDLLSCILLWMAPEIQLHAVGITNGDCIADQAFEAMIKIATYLDFEGTEIAVTEDDVPNAFPDNWRRESYIINELPLFSENDFKKPYQQGKGRRIEVAFADCLAHSKTPVSIVATCPLTNIAKMLRGQPELADNIAEVITMAGAINVKGNVAEHGCDGSAEWNVYADPKAFKEVMELVPHMKLIPLDVTNTLPVTPDFLARLEAQSEKHRASKLAARLFSLVKGFEYFFWDTVTSVATIDPSIFTFKEMKIDIAVQGRSIGKTSTSMFGGRKVQVATHVDREKFEQLLLSILCAR
jgi:purine nucleosidase